jgi:hypothetical protein
MPSNPCSRIASINSAGDGSSVSEWRIESSSRHHFHPQKLAPPFERFLGQVFTLESVGNSKA